MPIQEENNGGDDASGSDAEPGQESSEDRYAKRRNRLLRRREQMAAVDQTVPSPCIGICAYNEENVCGGCFRTPDEIRDWSIMGKEEKLAVLTRLRNL